jgi:Flp pilus assembly protein TadG
VKRVKWSQFRKNESAAVAPTIALSLFALIAVGGVGFDYARMAAMDSELQNAADQAALAAATQLDGETGAMTRATTAAQSLVTNSTLFSNDNVGSTAISIPTANVVFYVDKAKATVATSDADANFVEVTTVTREANFALTPIVAAFSSGALDAIAFAGVGSSICRTPPVMFCNPFEPDMLTFDANALRGRGVRLVTGNADVPGNFGWLKTGIGNGAGALAQALGGDVPPGDCVSGDGVSTKTGMNAVVLNAFNTRFDLDINGNNTCPAGVTCSSALNPRKDLVRVNQCGINGNNGWQEAPNPYRPTSLSPLTGGYPDIMGHPRDICHAIGFESGCAAGPDVGGRIGDGLWDRDAYFRVNYGYTSSSAWQTATGLSSTATRFEVYQWELANPQPAVPQGSFGGTNGYHYPVCRPAAAAGTPDRRRISAAVINCMDLGLNGSEDNVSVLKWIDLFLVEPAFNRGSGVNKRTEDKEIYVEVIGETTAGGGNGSGGNQVVARDVPYLIE